jgi:DNA-binding transcriptional MerR regulator
MRTVEVSRASGYSVQQVRDLERLGVIPPASRGANGYGQYSPGHVIALRAYRGLAVALGPVEARRVLSGLWSRPMADAAAEIGAAHVRLARERERLLDARAAVDALAAEPRATQNSATGGASAGPSWRGRGSDGGSGSGERVMSITELAGALDVRSSTLRFWEREGLVSSERVGALRVRYYDEANIRRVRIVAALRNGGHGVSAVRTDLASLDQHAARLDDIALQIDGQLDALAARSVALLEAGADLAAVMRGGPAASGTTSTGLARQRERVG